MDDSMTSFAQPEEAFDVSGFSVDLLTLSTHLAHDGAQLSRNLEKLHDLSSTFQSIWGPHGEGTSHRLAKEIKPHTCICPPPFVFLPSFQDSAFTFKVDVEKQVTRVTSSLTSQQFEACMGPCVRFLSLTTFPSGTSEHSLLSSVK